MAVHRPGDRRVGGMVAGGGVVRRFGFFAMAVGLGGLLLEGTVRVGLQVSGAHTALADARSERARMLGWHYASRPKILSTSLMHHPATGWTNRPGLSVEDGSTATVLADHRRDGVVPSVGRRTVFLGDSFTFGSDVADAEATPARVAVHAPGLAVENRGVPGFGFAQVYVLARSLGLARGDRIVVGVNTLEARRSEAAFTSYLKPRLADGCVVTPEVVPAPEVLRASLRWSSHAWTVLSAYGAEGQRDDVTWPGATRALRCLLDWAGEAGVEVVLVEQSVARTSTLSRCEPHVCDLEDWMAQFCEAATCVYGFEALGGMAASHQSHWNAAAHDRLARAIVAAME
jgi:hypothetical protein